MQMGRFVSCALLYKVLNPFVLRTQSNEENSTSIPIVSRVPDDVLALSSCDSMDSSTSDVSSDITAPQFSPISSDASSIHDELVELGGHVHSENIAELCCVQETIPSGNVHVSADNHYKLTMHHDLPLLTIIQMQVRCVHLK